MSTPDITVEIVGTHTSPEQLYRNALDHANNQADAVTPRSVTVRLTTPDGGSTYTDPYGVIGGAWVQIPEDGDFARWAVNVGKGVPECNAVVFPAPGPGGLEQSAAWAAGFAAVLCEAGIRGDIHVVVD